MWAHDCRCLLVALIIEQRLCAANTSRLIRAAIRAARMFDGSTTRAAGEGPNVAQTKTDYDASVGRSGLAS